MQRFAQTAETIASTRSKLAKIAALSEYFRELQPADLRAAAIFFTGRPFPQFDARKLNVGGSALAGAIREVSAVDDQAMHDAYLERADLGEVAEKLLPAENQMETSPSEVFAAFGEIVNMPGTANKRAAIVELLRRVSPTEAKYLIKIVTGEMRIGLKENTVEEAIAKAFDRSIDAVRRTNMALGDIGETAVMAQSGSLDDRSLRLRRPVKFMLATPAESEEEIFGNFKASIYVEDKYDGIRGQLHVDPPRAAIFSRTLDDVSTAFPEIIDSAERMAQELNTSLIVDGEVVAWRDGQVLPFSLLQSRLGRKKPSGKLLADVPVRLMIFDILYLQGQTLIDEPLRERKRLLQQIAWPGHLMAAPFLMLEERVELEPLFDQAMTRRNEGLMLKDADSSYVPGKRGMSWMKWKKTLATLDVVVTGVEFGHGRRRNVLSDYTFAVEHEGRLLNIGKAYSGLTDEEITEMTAFFKEHTVADHGRFREVEPVVVLEVTFNGIQKSARHKSGFALRFPRIVRIRRDKSAAEIDTLQTVSEIFSRYTMPTVSAIRAS